MLDRASAIARGGLHRLRQGTLDLHHEAERHVRILDDDADTATYARYLTRMLGFHAPMEDAFARHLELSAAGFDSSARRKQDLLKADLAALGLDASTMSICADLPDINSLARAVGAAYVLEGSTLGGPFIIKRMRLRPGYFVDSASSFLAGYRDATGPMWRRFATVVERAIVDAETGHAAVDAARATFVKLIAWLDEPGADPPHPFRWQSGTVLARSGLES